MTQQPGTSPGTPAPATPWGWLGLAFLVIALDQTSKWLVLERFSYGERLNLVPGWFDFTLVFNTGAAFSFLAGAGGWQRWLFTILGIGAALLIHALLRRHSHQTLFASSLALIMGGAIGNVIDRLVHGKVVDFLLFYRGDWYFPAFNLADSAITVGAALLLIDEIRRMRAARARP